MVSKIILVNASTQLDPIRKGIAQARHSLRVCVDGDAVKFKIDGGTWSPGYGGIDPGSDYAYYQRNSEAEKCIAIVLNDDGTMEDQCYTWETAQTYAQQGKVVRAVQADGHMSIEAIQRLCDADRERYWDCFDPGDQYTGPTPREFDDV
ncbi:hypothetical protein HWC80_gp046 [Mycobacterium phage Indlulamithi]|uniref:Uncharacterized protein n=1 Tax=Mycobacterium phage Indlulamithi TaxID=2656582 RepID=A0A649VCQ1_9CAUD|nr:hypothetical protein HWC80_gp046 [Mycobacterium phage Indlulamithi]QGJ90086.1 hypothetical protein PBI_INDLULAMITHI_46 [Mycobacterium phage Indlulamithi]